MNRTAWRIVQRRFAKEAFSGSGARTYGGRWNSRGRAVVYLAESQALAALEILVHVDSENLLHNYVVIPVGIGASLIRQLGRNSLPRNWRAYPAPKATQLLGDIWLQEGTSAALEVPSAVIPAESNFLINPAHPDFAKLEIGKAQPFEFDLRLAKRP